MTFLAVGQSIGWESRSGRVGTVTGQANNLGNLLRANGCRENGFPEVPQ
jgi:hypothetical protein